MSDTDATSLTAVQLAQLTVHDLQTACHALAKNAGWWNEYHEGDATLKKHFIGGKLALVHSEVSEALEGFRKGRNDDHLEHRPQIEVEFADAIIRILDMAGALSLDVAGAIGEKLIYNTQRPDHKLENRALEGGKSI